MRTVVLVQPDDVMPLLSDSESVFVLMYYARRSWLDFCDTFSLDPESTEWISSLDLLKHIAKHHPITAFREELVDILAEFDLIFAPEKKLEDNDFYGEWIDLFEAYDRIMQYAESHIDDIFEIIGGDEDSD